MTAPDSSLPLNASAIWSGSSGHCVRRFGMLSSVTNATAIRWPYGEKAERKSRPFADEQQVLAPQRVVT